MSNQAFILNIARSHERFTLLSERLPDCKGHWELFQVLVSETEVSNLHVHVRGFYNYHVLVNEKPALIQTHISSTVTAQLILAVF